MLKKFVQKHVSMSNTFMIQSVCRTTVVRLDEILLGVDQMFKENEQISKIPSGELYFQFLRSIEALESCIIKLRNQCGVTAWKNDFCTRYHKTDYHFPHLELVSAFDRSSFNAAEMNLGLKYNAVLTKMQSLCARVRSALSNQAVCREVCITCSWFSEVELLENHGYSLN